MTGGQTEEQKLRPLGIYSINHTLGEIADEFELKVNAIAATFDKEKRIFCYAAVTNNRWNKDSWNNTKSARHTKKALEDFYNDFDGSELEAVKDYQSFEYINEILTLIKKITTKDAELAKQEDIDSLIELYFKFGGHCGDLVPGIVYRKLEKNHSDYPVKRFAFGIIKDRPFPPSLNGQFSYRDDNCEDWDTYEQEKWSEKQPLFLGRLIAFFYDFAVLDYGIAIPIWDIWLRDEGYGGLCGILMLPFHTESEREKFESENFGRLPRHCENISQNLFNSGLAKIASEQIEPPYDLAHHFVRSLAHVQDWEQCIAYRGDEPAFCYCRKEKESGIAVQWQEDRAVRIEYNPKNLPGRWLKWKKEGFRIWDKRLVPSLTEEEIFRYGDYTFEFRYPETSFVPTDQHIEKEFHDEIFRQQMTVMGLLAPKVRVQRHAVRRAVSGIMGRNMSHNIGSHVLARYASEIREDAVTESDAPDHRGEFLTYLQRRMDFLAEIATADRAFWFQALSLPEQIDRLNLCKQRERYNKRGAGAEVVEPVLLRFITGKESLKATVTYEGGDTQFACPGGEVGVHALLVILENIVRNSARHGNDGGSTVELTVRQTEDGRAGELLKLDIVDGRSETHPEGRDNRLDKEINEIIGEPFLDETGEANPENWGVREMQICAHYLRGFSLFELEDKPGGEQTVLKAGSEGGKLKYTIYLRRAKRMAAIVSKKGDLSNLKEQGILILNEETDDIQNSDGRLNWQKIGILTDGYDFLVVEEGIEDLTDCPRTRAEKALPVRTLQLARKKIEKLIENAKGPGGGSSWMEPLHRRQAELVRDKREAWKGKPLYGVAISAGQALQRHRAETDPWPEIPDCGGVVHARKTTKKEDKWKPLPNEAEAWLELLDPEGCAIAAAWVDHGSKIDFYKGHCGLGQSSKLASRGDTKRLWISAESARSGDSHSRFLSDKSNGGWEVLAAAVPRVAVLDERVQSAGSTVNKGLRHSDIWRYMGVWTPPEGEGGCNLDAPNIEECRKFLANPTKRCEQYPIDILILHLTILERLHVDRNPTEPPLQDTLKALIDGTQAQKAEIVIVTGRGVPTVAQAAGGDGGAGLPGVRYLPISALLESLALRPSKLALMRTLWSAGVPPQTVESKGNVT